MLYVFHGTDVAQSAKKARTLIDSLRAKRPDAAFEHLTAEKWNPSVLESHLGGQGLFSNKYVVFLDRLNENPDVKEVLGEFIPALAESPNIFIVLEGKLNVDLIKAFEKHAEKMIISDVLAAKRSFGSSGAGSNNFNIFALADALGARDPMKAWTIYQQALEHGQEAESIIGTLFWQAKSMSIAAHASSVSQSGLSPFAFTKSKKYAANYSPEEMRTMTRDLVLLYHDGHRGLTDVELGLELFLLRINKR